MKIIAHRGNRMGPDPATENTPDAIDAAIREGFDCEVDVWMIGGTVYLGHDYPATPVPLSFLRDRRDKLWVHCKHLDALVALKDSMNCFYHDKDLYTVTSKGFIWGNINSPCHSSVIQVMPERSGCLSTECAGVCTDYPHRYRALLIPRASILMSGPIRPSSADVRTAIQSIRSQVPSARMYLCTWTGQLTDEIRTDVDGAWEVDEPSLDAVRGRTQQERTMGGQWTQSIHRMITGVQTLCEFVRPFIADSEVVIRIRTDSIFQFREGYLQELLAIAKTHYVVRNRPSSGDFVRFDDWFAIAPYRMLVDAWTFADYDRSLDEAWNAEDLIRRNCLAKNIPVHILDNARVTCFLQRDGGRKEVH